MNVNPEQPQAHLLEASLEHLTEIATELASALDAEVDVRWGLRHDTSEVAKQSAHALHRARREGLV